jgi:L-fuculose-phosphate aldolase
VRNLTSDDEKTQIWRDFRKFGRLLDLHGMNTSHSGNMSVRRGDRIFITRRGSMSADIKKNDVIETGIYEDDSGIVLASTETIVHRAIYRDTSALAVIHAHPPYAIVLSLLEKEIIAVDAEGSYHIHKIPVVDLKVPVGSTEAAEKVPPVLKKYKAVVVRSHGVFTTGSILEEAYMWVSIVDSISRLRYLALQAGYKDEHKDYEKW